MKTHKFRAYDKANKEWVYKFSLSSQGDGEITNIQYPYDRDMSYERTVNNDWVVVEFTGLLDKNGKEIYEGDVYVWVLNDGEPTGRPEKIPELPKLFHLVGEHMIVPEGITIIGNIYENPELLK